MTSIATSPSDHGSIKPSPMMLDHDYLGADNLDDCMSYQTTSAVSAKRDNVEIDDRIDNSNANMKRSLNFQNTTSILWIERTENMSDEEISNCFYNERDYSCFKDRERRLSRNCSNWRFMKGGRSGDLLGVESRLQRFHRRERSRNAVYAVILEQELRQERNEDSDSRTEEDALGIARVYQQYTQESARLARERATVNASEIGRTASFSLYPNRYSMTKIDMGKWEEKEHSTERQNDLPWEVPTSNKNEQMRSRSTDMIKYATCSTPTYSGHHFDILHFTEQGASRKQSRDLHYEEELQFYDRGGNHDNRRQEAPLPQKIIQAEGYDEIQNYFHLSPQLEVSQQAQPETIAQEWMRD